MVTKVEQQDGKDMRQSVSVRLAFAEGKVSLQFPILGKLMVRLVGMHCTSAASERNWSVFGQLYRAAGNKTVLQRAQKLVTLKAILNKELKEEDDETMLEKTLAIMGTSAPRNVTQTAQVEIPKAAQAGTSTQATQTEANVTSKHDKGKGKHKAIEGEAAQTAAPKKRGRPKKTV